MPTTRTGDEAPGTPRPAWERQPCDTNASWPYFRAYRDTPPGIKRTLARIRFRPADARHQVARQDAPTLQELNDWCIEHKWIERVAAYDLHLDRVQTQEQEALMTENGRDLAIKHRAVLQDAYELARKGLEDKLAAIDAGNLDLRMSDLNKLIEHVVKLGRLVHGESTENTEVHADLSKLTPDELRQYLDLASKAEGDGG